MQFLLMLFKFNHPQQAVNSNPIFKMKALAYFNMLFIAFIVLATIIYASEEQKEQNANRQQSPPKKERRKF